MKVVRTVVAAAVAIAGCVALAGCVQQQLPSPAATIPHDAPAGGQTADELAATVASIEGIELERFSCSEPNVKGNTGCRWSLRLTPGFQLVDRVALVDFLVESAWSVRDGYQPNTSIEISFIGNPADQFSMTDAVVEAGWSDWVKSGAPMADNGFTAASVWLTTDAQSTRGGAENLARLGAWPGDIPDVPAGLIAPVAP